MSTTQGTWWQQNWQWAVPIGCLGTGCLSALVLLGLVLATGAGMVSLLSGAVQSSGAYRTYQIASDRIKNEPTVIQQLGEPVSTGWIGNTRYREGQGTGKTCMSFSVSGSKRSGSVYVETIKSGGAWNFRQLVVKVDGTTETLEVIPLPDGDLTPLCPDSEFKDSPNPSVTVGGQEL